MSGSAPFRLNRTGLLLALISAAFAREVGAAAARVDFTTAGVTVAGRDGRTRPLAKGAELDSGDTVKTDTDGRAQLRFTDGSYVSLQPNTDFSISDYKFEGKSDDRGFFGLVRGAMRTVTGAVGRVNRNSYRITTPTATVGIRGTGGVVQILPSGATLVIGTSGIWSLTNPAGSIDIPAGVSGLAPTEPNQPPKETNTQPQSGPAPVQPKNEFVQGDQVNPDGTAAILPTVLISGGGYHTTAFWGVGSSSASSFSNGGVDAIFDGGGRLTEFKDAAGAMWKSDNAAHADFGTDGILAWGRWTGNVIANGSAQTYGPNGGMHYVIGTPTAVMPTSGSATYSLIGATKPTDGATTGTFSGSLNILFGANHTIGVNFAVAMSDKTYLLTGSSTTCGAGSAFSMSTSITAAPALCSGCTSFVQGFFAGASAERAGIGYHIQDFSTGPRNIVGTAAFQKN
jgi:hypothetical protein